MHLLPLWERVVSHEVRNRVRGLSRHLRMRIDTPHPPRFARHPLPQGERVDRTCRYRGSTILSGQMATRLAARDVNAGSLARIPLAVDGALDLRGELQQQSV